MSKLNSSNYKSYKTLDKATPRIYQSKIMHDVLARLKEILRSDENKAKSLSGSTPIYPKLTSALIEAATGSGKTSTIGFTLEEIWKTKNRFNQINTLNQFPNLNILVLNDRIGLVEQLRNELVHGSVDEDKKTIKQPILSNEFIKHLAIKTYHSKADNDELYKYNGSTEIEVDDETSIQATDSMHFATLQTAKTEAACKLIGQPNIIIVDEADIISMGSNFAYGEYMETLMSYYVPDEYGNYPIILAMTATPDNITKDIFGEPISRFPLAEYLASERGPEVQMYIETPPVEDQTLIPSILSDIQRAKTITDYEAKKQIIAEIGERIDSLFPDRKTPEQKEAYLERAVLSICDKIDDGDRSMVFVESITDADYVTRRINEIKGLQTAVARHSDNPESVTDTMQNLKNGTMPVVVSVGQLIRGIDVPSVDNIFSLVNTASAKKYIQLFGRGMRGKAVKFYDYGCSIENLARAGDIYTEYEQYREQGGSTAGGTGGGIGGELDLYINNGEYGDSNSHQVDILNLIQKYVEVDNELLLTADTIKRYLLKIGYDTLINFNSKDIKNLRIGGKGIQKISSICGYPTGDGRFSLSTPSGFQDFINFLFKKDSLKDLTKKEEIGLNEVKSYFDRIGYDELMKYIATDIERIKIGSHSIKSIRTKSGFTSKYGLNIKTPSGFQEFISWLYEKEFTYQEKNKSILNKKNIEVYFENIGYNKLIKYKVKDILKIQIKDHKIKSIAAIIGFNKKSNLNIQNTSGFQEFIKFLFQRKK